MENIKQWFINNQEKYKIEINDGVLYARSKTIYFMIVSPRDGNKNKWMLRVTTISSFDRWANSTAVELFFNTDTELINYLSNHQLDIYKDLLEYLSLEYDELDKEYRKLT